MRSGQDPGLGPMASSLRRHRRRRGLPPIILLLLLVAGGAGVWMWLRTGAEETPPAPVEESSREPAFPEPAEQESIELPPLEESDPIARTMALGLSSHPRWAAWLVSEDMVHTFVQAVVDVAGGGRPVSALEFWAPADSFSVRPTEGGLVVDPGSYRRYDLAVEVFTSVDAEATARLYRQLHPLFLEAYAELEVSDPTFDEMFESAIRNLLSIEVPEGAVEVEPHEGVYDYANPEYEALSAAQKQLLRLGPQNARRLQQKIREVAEAIGIARTP
jgi:hypothetical protein